MSITFLAISFLMGLFVNAARNNDRSQTYSTAAFLAQGRMEVLAATPIDQLVTGNDTFAGQFSSYVYDVDVQDAGDYDGDGVDDGDLKVVTLRVTAPGGKAVASLVALRTMPIPFFNSSCHGSDPNLTFMGSAKPNKRFPRGWDYTDGLDPVSIWFYNLTQSQRTMPNGGRPGAVAATPDLTKLYAVDYVNRGVRFIDSAMTTWSPTLLRPAGLGYPTGIATSQNGDVVWLADETNRCLWRYDTGTGTWSNQIKPTNPGDTLGRLRGVTCSADGSTVYVADLDYDCVRQYSGGAWNPTPLKNPDGSLDNVQGVAVTRDGSKLYVLDQNGLQFCDPATAATTWRDLSLDSKLEEDIPQGLSVSDDGNTVWAVAANGLLFRCDLSSYTVDGCWYWEELGP
ncbi:MAG: hypothetical protein AMXMBFR33_45560 [Candidatus Xenobia bacterium]